MSEQTCDYQIMCGTFFHSPNILSLFIFLFLFTVFVNMPLIFLIKLFNPVPAGRGASMFTLLHSQFGEYPVWANSLFSHLFRMNLVK